MKIIKADSKSIERAAVILKTGGLVAFPTETVYGLGANAFDSRAIERIFSAKKRPTSNPLIVHTYNLDKLLSYAYIKDAGMIAKITKLSKFWPGPLTVVLPRSQKLSSAVSKNSDSVALRIPANQVALELLKICDLPVAAPSANPSGYISPTTALHVEEGLGDAVDLILDGGECQIGIESTVLSLLNHIPAILRPGAITLEQIEEALSEKVELAVSGHETLSPGLLSEHYSPRTPLIFTEQANPSEITGKKIGVISFGNTRNLLPAREVVQIKLNPDLKDIAHGLYAAMHELDAKGLDFIMVDKVLEHGLGLAIMDRLKRAAKK